jgi:hypothetical protein
MIRDAIQYARIPWMLVTADIVVAIPNGASLGKLTVTIELNRTAPQ